METMARDETRNEILNPVVAVVKRFGEFPAKTIIEGQIRSQAPTVLGIEVKGIPSKILMRGRTLDELVRKAKQKVWD